MRKTFFTFLVFLIVAFVGFLLLSTNGFLGEEIGKTGADISASIDKVVNQGVGAITELAAEEKPKPVQEDPKIQRFFQQLKTATPETLSDMIVKGFKPTKPNLAGEPPIVYMARYNDNPEVYELMLNIGASVAQTNRKGENALKVAIERGAPLEVIRILYADQEEIDKMARQDKINQGPGAQVISSYYPSIEQNTAPTKNTIYTSGYRRNKNLQGLE
jgi:hypothetical protein